MKHFVQRALIPLLALGALLFLLWQSLAPKQQDNISPMISKQFPAFSLPDLYKPSSRINQSNLNGKVALVNVWASWCYACEAEHKMLMNISKQYHIPIYGIDYKDKPKEAKKWLRQHGNPFTRVIEDQHGSLAVDLGIYGTPETFIVANGEIVFHHTGVINQENWEKVMLPIVKWYRA